MLARQARGLRRIRHGVAATAALGLTLAFLLSIILPLVGLLLPLLGGGNNFPRARQHAERTAIDTLLYAAGAGGVAAVLGLLLAFCVGREQRLLAASLGLCLLLFALPPALPALGIVQLAAAAPAWTDPLLRSRLTVCLALALRFFPVAALLALRAWGSMPPSWVLAAAVHGVPLNRFQRRVVLPHLLPASGVALLLVALLSLADVGTVLLVHPPGHQSFPLAIFTVMANAPEALVASLCLLYLATAAGLLVLFWTVAQRAQA
jgi:iron(III) transport system permease protein